jgi:hypothetical protein
VPVDAGIVLIDVADFLLCTPQGLKARVRAGRGLAASGVATSLTQPPHQDRDGNDAARRHHESRRECPPTPDAPTSTMLNRGRHGETSTRASWPSLE